MFATIDEKVFWLEIAQKNYENLKVDVVGAMLDDPTFARGEAEKVLQILQERVPEIFEEEVHLEYEERLDKAEWDKRYFTKLTYWFQENFALSRVAYIKEVGKVVHADTEAAYNESLRLHAVPKAPITRKTTTNKATVPPKPVTKPATNAPAAPKPLAQKPVAAPATPGQAPASQKPAGSPVKNTSLQVKSPVEESVTRGSVARTVTNPPKAPEKSKKQALKKFPVVATIAAVCALVLGMALLLKMLLA